MVRRPLALAVTLAVVIIALGLLLSTAVAHLLTENFGVDVLYAHGIKAVLMSLIVVGGIGGVRRGVDRRSLSSFGLVLRARSLLDFVFGSALLLGPLLLAVVTGHALGWVTVEINAGGAAGRLVLLSALLVLFFEAIPEEFAFRGYVYRRLSAEMQRWRASLITVACFAMVPVLVWPLQTYVLGLPGTIGNAETLTLGYVVTMVFFGAFVQYLRVLTGTFWVTAGFHFAFVYSNHIMGDAPEDLVRFVEVQDEGSMQVIFLGALLAVFVGLLATPRLRGRALGWREVEAESQSGPT